MAIKQSLGLKLKTDQRMSLLGRMRMADWIEMPESEFAQEIERVEKDPLFQKLFFGTRELAAAIRRQRWPRGGLSSGLFEMNEGALAGRERVQVENLLEDRKGLAAAIKAMGQEAFERYFVHAEEPLTLEEIGKRTKLSLEKVRAIHDFLLEMGAHAEFSGAAPKAEAAVAQACLARITLEDDGPSFAFYSAHWARGLYQVRYDAVEEWKSRGLEAGERKRLSSFLKKLETLNLRQSTLYRIMESVCSLQADYLKTRRPEDLRPISLRQLARRLDLAPSTISRALAHRSVLLPWDKEARLIEFLPGRRRVVKSLLAHWLTGGESDAVLAERLKKDHGIRISRRTVNAVRNDLKRGA